MKTFLIISIFISFYTFSFIPSYAQQNTIFQKNNNAEIDTLIAADYFKKAKDFFRKSNYDSTIFYYKKAGEIYYSVKNWGKYIYCYNKLGKVFYILEEYKNAEDYLNKAIKINLTNLKKNNPQLANSYKYISWVFGSTGEYNKAIDYAKKTLDINILIFGKEDPKVANNYGNMGILYANLGDNDKAYELYQKALNIHLKVLGKEHPRIASSYNNMGIILQEKGYIDSALVFQKKALAIRLKTLGENHLYTAASYNNIAAIYNSIGDFQNALLYEKKVLAIRLALLNEKNSQVAYAYNNIGCNYYELEDYDKALQYQEKALVLRLSILEKDHLHIAASYTNLANIYEKLAKYQRALDYHNKALKIKIKNLGENNSKVGDTYHNIGLVYESKKDYKKAIDFYRKTVKIMLNEFGNKHPKVAENYNAIATGYKFLNDYDSTLFYINKALIANILRDDNSISINRDFLNRVLSKKTLLSSLLIKAETLFETNDFSEARIYFKLITSLINFIRKEYRSDESKLLLTAKQYEVYEKAIQTELKLLALDNNKNHLEDAFNYSESNKVGVLLESFTENQVKKISKIPDSLLQKENRLKTDLAYFVSQNQNRKLKNLHEDSLIIEQTENKIFTLNRNYQNLLDYFENNYPEYNELKYKTPRVTFNEIKKNLSNENILVEYFIGENNLYIFVITNERQEVVTVNIDKRFISLLESYIKSIKKNRLKKFRKISPQLYGYLIEPIQKFISGKEKLTIIPDGILLYIPFGSLVKDDISTKHQNDFTAYNYLIKEFDISYHYSAALWLKGKKKESNIKMLNDNFIGFAPVFKSKNNNGYVTLSNKFSADSSLSELTLRSVSIDGKQFDELTHSENEVNDIINLFVENKKQAKGYLYSQASERNFKEKISGYKYVHLATHGFSNDKKANLSALIFANKNIPNQNLLTEQQDSVVNNNIIDDGILFADETYNLDINADLLVLSACETGIGKLIKGEGVMAITRGFLYSGVNNILFSLWKVGDKNTYQLMVKFYKEILKGNSYSKAIKNAKLMLISKKETAFPKSWSSFVLIGR